MVHPSGKRYIPLETYIAGAGVAMTLHDSPMSHPSPGLRRLTAAVTVGQQSPENTPWGPVAAVLLCVLPFAFLLAVTLVRRITLPCSTSLPVAAFMLAVVRLAYLSSAPVAVLASCTKGLLEALTPLSVIYGAVLLFEAMQHSKCLPWMMHHVKRLSAGHPLAEVFLIGWAFAYMVSGIGGFNTPIALGAPMLVSLGHDPLHAMLVLVIMSTLASHTGSVGMAIWFGFRSLDLPAEDLLLVGLKSSVIVSAVSFVVAPVAASFLVPWRDILHSGLFVVLSIASAVVPMTLVAIFSTEFPVLIGGACSIGVTTLLIYYKIGLGPVLQVERVPTDGNHMSSSSFTSELAADSAPTPDHNPAPAKTAVSWLLRSAFRKQRTVAAISPPVGCSRPSSPKEAECISSSVDGATDCKDAESAQAADNHEPEPASNSSRADADTGSPSMRYVNADSSLMRHVNAVSSGEQVHGLSRLSAPASYWNTNCPAHTINLAELLSEFRPAKPCCCNELWEDVNSVGALPMLPASLIGTTIHHTGITGVSSGKQRIGLLLRRPLAMLTSSASQQPGPQNMWGIQDLESASDTSDPAGSLDKTPHSQAGSVFPGSGHEACRQTLRGVLTVVGRTLPLWLTVLLLVVTRVRQLKLQAAFQSTEPSFAVQLGSLGTFKLSASLVLQLQQIFLLPAVSWKYEVLYVPCLLPFVVASVATVFVFARDMEQQAAHIIFKHAWRKMKGTFPAFFGAMILSELMSAGGVGSPAFILGYYLSAWLGRGYLAFAGFIGALGGFVTGSVVPANTTFGAVQKAAAELTGVPITAMLAIQVAGACAGKMMCISSILSAKVLMNLHQVREGKVVRRTAPLAVLFVLLSQGLGLIFALGGVWPDSRFSAAPQV